MAETVPRIRAVIPPFPLSQFVDCFWMQSGYVQPHPRERVVPTGAIDLVFALRAGGRASCAVAGARSQCIEIDTSTAFSAIGVHFKAGGGSRFFGMPGGELENV